MVLELGTLRKVDQKYLESFIMWSCTKMEKIGRTDPERNELSHRAKKDRNIIYTVKRRKTN